MEKEDVQPFPGYEKVSVAFLVSELVKGLADRPTEVKVTEIEGSQATVLEVRVHKRDHGKLVGKKGRTATALREILVALGGKNRRRYLMTILE